MYYLFSIIVRVSNELGSGRPRAGKYVIIVSGLTTLFIGLCSSTLISATWNKFPLLCTSSKEVQDSASTTVYLLAIALMITCIQCTLSGAIIGGRWQGLVAYVNLGCYYLLGLPLAATFGFLFHWGWQGLWTGMLSGCMAQTLVLITMVCKTNWKGQKHCMWDSSMETQVKVAWAKKASERYSDFLRDIRKSEKKKKPQYIPEDDWKYWKVAWENDEFKRKREQNSNNRRSVVGPSSHTGGLISHTEHGNKLTSSLGRVPTPHELFIFTHTKKHDRQTFIDERSKSFNDKVVRLREASQANNGSGDDALRPIDEVALYYEAAGGEKKRRVYGLGSQSSCYYCIGDKDGNNRSINSFEFHNQDEISNELTSLRKTVQTQGSMITKLTRTIQALCDRISIPSPNESENAHNSQQDEHDEGTGGGDDNNDHGLS